MGLDSGGGKTKTGQWSTSAQVLEDLAAAGHDLPRKIVDWRQITKLKSTYTDALPSYVNPQTKRVHTSYAMAATTTGRLSSSEPNLQNIPVRNGRGPQDPHRLRGRARPCSHLGRLQPDRTARARPCRRYPQLSRAFAEGIDIHAMTASEMFGVPVEGMPSDVRRRAKALNFGIIYGISAFGLANQLGIERSEAGDYIKRYFEAFPRHQGLYGRGQGQGARIRLCRNLLRTAAFIIPTSALQSVRPRLQRTRRHQRADPGLGGRCHPSRHDQDGAALDAAKLKARMLLQVHDE